MISLSERFFRQAKRLIPDLAALFFLLLLVAFFFWRLWAPNPEDRLRFPRGDFTDQYYPLRHFVAASYAEGQMPFWNPYIFGGQPGLADPQAAAFYPPALLNALFWGAEFPIEALEAEVVAHIALAAWGAYLFVRLALGLGLMPALLAAIIFAFGGYLPGFPIQQVTIIETLAWLPWLLLTLHHAAALPQSLPTLRGKSSPPPLREGERAMGGGGETATSAKGREGERAKGRKGERAMTVAPSPPRRRGGRLISAALASLVLGCALLAGHPQSALYVAYVSGFYVLFLLISARPAPRDWLSSILPLLLPFVLGVGLAAMQLLPTLAFIEESSREELNYEFVQRGLQWKELLDIFLPKVLDSTPLYVGILPLLLALYALMSKQSLSNRGEEGGQRRFWGAVALISLLLALGGSSPFFDLLYLGLPYLDSVRSQERVLILWNWSIALLAAWGIAALLDMGQDKAERARLRLYVRKLANFIPLLFLPLLAIWWLQALEFAQFSLNLEVFTSFFSRYAFFTFIFLLAWGLLAWYSRRLGNYSWGKALSGMLLLALVVLDLFSITRASHFGERADRYVIRDNEVVETLQTLLANNPARVGIVGKARPRDNDGMYWRFPLLSGNEPLRLERTENFMESVSGWRQFQLLSARYVVADSDLSIGQADAFELLASATSRPESYLLGVRPPMPYAWVVTQMEEPDDRKAAYKRLNEDSFDPYMIALRREAPLELATESTSVSVTVLKRAAGFAEVHVANPSNGLVLLIFAEPYVSDWLVLLDGTARRKLAVNEFNLSITVPAGEHTITLQYDPSGWQEGLRISGVSLLSVLIMLGVGLWRLVIGDW
jgi:hypothetical protein